MLPFLHTFFHNETNDKSEKGMICVPKDRSSWPASWKTIEYKKYNLFKSIPLTKTEGKVFDILHFRQTTFDSNTPLTLDTLSYILKCGYGLQNDIDTKNHRKENRTVPSAGQRYPLEIYLFMFSSGEKYSSGVYHYGVREHALEPVFFSTFSGETISTFSLEEKVTKNAKGMICITSVFNRTVEKYGSRGYRYILLEAGHVAQNIILAGTEKGLHFVPVGGCHEENIEAFLGLGSQHERAVYTLFF